MGIFDSFTSETKRNFIARPDEAREDIIYRYPEKNIRMLTQLTVQPDEMAIFVKGGKVIGHLEPGTHSLDSNNIPFLSTLLEKFTGGNLFVAELYFVSTREIPSVRFGGPVGQLTDPVTQMMCETMVYGDFSVQVVEPETLIFKLVGSGKTLQSNNQFLDWFKSILMAHLSDALGELGLNWPLNKVISPHFKLELQGSVTEKLKPELQRYGFEVVRFGNFVVSISDEDKAELNKRNMAIADDQRRMQMAQNPAYMTVAQVEALRGAGQGMAKGGGGADTALAGMGFGMGLNMSQMMGGAMQPQQQQQAQQPAPQGVKCGACGQMSAPGKFCNQCGSALAQASKCECGTDLAPGAKFCGNCGKAAGGPAKCECGAELSPGAKFCNNCGKKVG